MPQSEQDEGSQGNQLKEPPVPLREEDDPGDSNTPQYQASLRKHRFSILRLDHIIEVVSHPGFLFIVTITILFIFLLTRYIGAALENELLLKINEDFSNVLPYMGTIVITHIITKYIGSRKK